MSYPASHPVFDQATELLRANNFVVATRLLDTMDQPVVVAESAYALAVLLAGDRWSDVADAVDRTQVALVNWSSEADHSSRRWDLYVVVLLQDWPDTPGEGAAIEEAEANTELARKIVRSGVVMEDPERVRDALRPLLPLEAIAKTSLPDVGTALIDRLRVHGIASDVAERAVSGFLQGGRVWV